MIRVIRGNKNSIKELSEFIGRINKLPEKNIGYLGEDPLEIEESLRDYFPENTIENFFVLAYEDEKLVGVLGMDIDEEKGVGEALGPFIDTDNYKETETILFTEIDKILPTSLKRINMYFNKENKRCKEISEKLEGEYLKEFYYMGVNKENFLSIGSKDITEVEKDDYKEFIELHEEIFKEPYYSGQDIINRLNEDRKVLIFKDENSKGYMYVEYNEEFHEGSIEFIGVKEESRGLGIGKKLLSSGINWLFSNKNLEVINLNTSTDNKAFYLYKSLGFNTEKILYYYKVDRRNIKLIRG